MKTKYSFQRRELRGFPLFKRKVLQFLISDFLKNKSGIGFLSWNPPAWWRISCFIAKSEISISKLNLHPNFPIERTPNLKLSQVEIQFGTQKTNNSLRLKVILISCETIFSSSATIHMVLNFSIAEEIGQSFCPQANTDWFLTFKNLLVHCRDKAMDSAWRIILARHWYADNYRSGHNYFPNDILRCLINSLPSRRSFEFLAAI